LARHFVARERLEALIELGPELLTELEARPWHGNARELRNFLIRSATQSASSAGVVPAERAPSLRDTRSCHERRAIEAALAASGGSVGAAALTLRLHVTTLRRKMRALGIER
jgi:DNA-binding NtrC family response regulator